MALTLIGVLHLRFAAPRAVWTPTVNFLGAQGWSFFGGTSASAPMVTGTAGILEALGAGSLPISSNYLTASGDPIVQYNQPGQQHARDKRKRCMQRVSLKIA